MVRAMSMTSFAILNPILYQEESCYRNWWSNVQYYHRTLKNRPIHHTQTYNSLCTSDITKYIQYTSPERSTTRTNDPVDDRDTYIQLGDAYIHFTQPDQHYTITSPDTQWYHTSHCTPTYFHSRDDPYARQSESMCIHHADIPATNRTLTISLLSTTP